jgi:2'-5' RNA ligase
MSEGKPSRLFVGIPVTDEVLFQSHLGGAAPRYEPLERFPF